MDLRQNPFYLLGATSRDSKHSLIELAEELSLTHDADVCSKARSDLTNPRTRLGAEVAWFPGVSPRRASELLRLLDGDPSGIKAAENLPPLARANLLVSAMQRSDLRLSVFDWADWLENLAYVVDSIDAENVLRDINEDRSIAVVTEVRSISVVEEELDRHREYYRSAAMTAIRRLTIPERAEVTTKLVEGATCEGLINAPVLVDELIDSYVMDVQSVLEETEHQIGILVFRIKEAASRGSYVLPLVEDLNGAVRSWDKYAQPIQVSLLSRSRQHDASYELAYRLRNLAIRLWNDHQLAVESSLIINTLQDVFAELPDYREKLAEDGRILDEMQNAPSMLLENPQPSVQAVPKGVLERKISFHPRLKFLASFAVVVFIGYLMYSSRMERQAKIQQLDHLKADMATEKIMMDGQESSIRTLEEQMADLENKMRPLKSSLDLYDAQYPDGIPENDWNQYSSTLKAHNEIVRERNNLAHQYNDVRQKHSDAVARYNIKVNDSNQLNRLIGRR